jgi:transcriptional regulator with XRE-family HTH domain
VSVVIHPGRLRQALARRGWSAADLARVSGVSRPTVGAALGGRPITARSLRLMAEALAKEPALTAIDDLLMLDGDDRHLD